MTRLRFAAALLAFPLSAAALEPVDAASAYERLQQARFSAASPLPAGGVTITHDTATWKLESGSVRLMEPLADGTITGLVFEGSGRFRMTIPDKYELAQLRRFAEKRELTEIDQPITQLVLRTSDPRITKLFAATSTAPYETVDAARKRHEFWIEKMWRDVDALVVAALLNGSTQLIADAKTADFGWLLYEHDSWRGEEITLTAIRNTFPESWVSLDRPEDRGADGRPGRARDVIRLSHVDVKADLTRGGRDTYGRNWQREIAGEYVVDETYTSSGAPITALRLRLHPRAKELKVTDDRGTPLAVIRDALGKRSADIDNDVSDDDFLVVLPAPLASGQSRVLRFAYEWESANYAPGGSWYPMPAEAMLQPHTARLELMVHKKNEARAMGRLEKRTDGDRSETTVWVIDKPVRMVTFSTATRFEEVKLTPAGIPPVIAFGPDFQFGNRQKVHNVGADVANSLMFFQNILDDKLDVEQLYVTSIAAGHGQAFEGFLHMTEGTFASEHPGASELFRAHEVAHEWFGHKIGFASYRDQWLTESFAEYAAILFVQSFVRGGEKYFDEILRSYDGIVRGLPLAGGFSKFNRPWLARMNLRANERARIGPLGHGWRANTVDIPAYAIQSYFKGPLVLHMIRSILRIGSGSDELFVRVLRDYVRLGRGKDASTEDFRAILEQRTGADWKGFFDSWIYGAEIPTYTWSYKAAPAEGGFDVTLDLERRDTAPDFTALIPVRVELEDGKVVHFLFRNTKDRESVTRKLPGKPKKVIFAPDYSLLAYVKRD